jgi:galactokinase
VVARAPGRLDVMGGIADYSGSLVLQLPLAEACHVAAQLRPSPSGVSCAARDFTGLDWTRLKCTELIELH